MESLVGEAESAKSKISSEVASLKTSKLADSNSVKQLLTPDKTLERNVSKLTKDLPESINNLNSSFSNFSPQSSSTSTVTNEGAKIDQSSTVNSMQPNNRQVSQPETASPQANSQTGMNQSDFYMQAIYAALMSGKIRVKLEQL
jgi:septation ring formation regulator EzrA